MATTNGTKKTVEKTETASSDQLRSIQLRVTPLRIALLEFMLAQETPVDVQTCVDFLTEKKVKFDQVSVYRNLEHFVNKGVLKKVDLRDGRYYYEKADACSHLICESCGTIAHIHFAELEEATKHLEEKLLSQNKFKIRVPSTDFFGVCEKCQ